MTLWPCQKKIGADVVFVDGNSNDGSVEFLCENNVSVIQQADSGRGNAAFRNFNIAI